MKPTHRLGLGLVGSEESLLSGMSCYLRKLEGTAEIPAEFDGQAFWNVVAFVSEPTTVRVLSNWKKLMTVADSCARTAPANKVT